jgi:hypothetical protein
MEGLQRALCLLRGLGVTADEHSSAAFWTVAREQLADHHKTVAVLPTVADVASE